MDSLLDEKKCAGTEDHRTLAFLLGKVDGWGRGGRPVQTGGDLPIIRKRALAQARHRGEVVFFIGSPGTGIEEGGEFATPHFR
jgi:hypothetical protein